MLYFYKHWNYYDLYKLHLFEDKYVPRVHNVTAETNVNLTGKAHHQNNPHSLFFFLVDHEQIIYSPLECNTGDLHT